MIYACLTSMTRICVKSFLTACVRRMNCTYFSNKLPIPSVVVKILRKNRIDNDNMITVPSSQLIIEDSELSHIFVKRNTVNLFNSNEDHHINEDGNDDDDNDKVSIE
ncbi:unnamed protein product [Trichobilharzia regenti]|nr:unnamed protein product [Trichobilharzia regenti]